MPVKKNFVTTTYTWYKNEMVAIIVQPPEQISGPAKYSLGGIEEIKQLIVCPLPPSPFPLFVVQEGPRGPMIETSKIEKVETKHQVE